MLNQINFQKEKILNFTAHLMLWQWNENYKFHLWLLHLPNYIVKIQLN